MTLVFTEIMEKIDKAARNGTKLHLPINLVRALATSDAYATLAALKAKEFAALWAEERGPQPQTTSASSSGRSGCGIGPSEMNGASAGMTTAGQDEAVERAERRRALAAVAMTASRRKRRKTP